MIFGAIFRWDNCISPAVSVVIGFSSPLLLIVLENFRQKFKLSAQFFVDNLKINLYIIAVKMGRLCYVSQSF
jgi:galactitol-specific phosphotransferase system IIC component